MLHNARSHLELQCIVRVHKGLNVEKNNEHGVQAGHGYIPQHSLSDFPTTQ
jgi:hypothetical protein